MSGCNACPRRCGVDRTTAVGACGVGAAFRVARMALHAWEEPCISGKSGSGAIFFSGCPLKGVFCQNMEISRGCKGVDLTEDQLIAGMQRLIDAGAQNINLVSPTQYAPALARLLRRWKSPVPVVYNTGGYERVETLRALEGYVDIYLPDVKYYSDELAVELSQAPHYFETAMNAVAEMVRQTGSPAFSGDMLKKGVIVRHLVLPYHYRDSVEVIKRVGERFGKHVLFSLMSQYTPFWKAKDIPRLNRRITTFEYRKALDAVYEAGLDGFMQERSSAREEYTPDFDLSGI